MKLAHSGGFSQKEYYWIIFVAKQNAVDCYYNVVKEIIIHHFFSLFLAKSISFIFSIAIFLYM